MSRDFLVYGVTLRARGGIAAAGVITLPYQRRGDFQRLVRELRERHDGPRRISWKKVRRKHLPYFEALVDAFFAQKWLVFRGVVDPAAGDDEQAGARHLAALTGGAQARLDGGDARHRVRVARRAHAEAADGALVLAARSAPALQLARLLLSAVRAAHRGSVRSAAKQALMARLAARLGVSDLAAVGGPAGASFQVWFPRELEVVARLGARLPQRPRAGEAAPV